MSEVRKYKIGGKVISLAIEEPWTFKALTPEQKTLVEKLSRGEDAGVESVPADRQEQLAINDSIMGVTHMDKDTWDGLSDTSRREWRYALDLIHYEPFRYEGDEEPIFTFTVKEGQLDDSSRDSWEKVVSVDDVMPYYFGYTFADTVIYEFYYAADRKSASFVLREDGKVGEFYVCKGVGPETAKLALNTCLMVQFTTIAGPMGILLLHSSVTRYKGKGNLFFGVSGTGKSTHSRLWHTYIPGCDLMNDDNPVVDANTLTVFGTPWSGKTLCYRNVQAPVGALVRLEQAPENIIGRLTGLQAYASVVASVSSIRWDSNYVDRIIPHIERLAMGVPCYNLQCRPDREAAELCKNTIS